MSLLYALLAWLAAILSGTPAVELEHARASAAVTAARASMERDAPVPQEPEVRPACDKCGGSGWIRVDAKTRRKCSCGVLP